jgi:hypothetical protein
MSRSIKPSYFDREAAESVIDKITVIVKGIAKG